MRPHRGWAGHPLLGPQSSIQVYVTCGDPAGKQSATHLMDGSRTLPPRGAPGHVGHSPCGGDMELYTRLQLLSESMKMWM